MLIPFLKFYDDGTSDENRKNWEVYHKLLQSYRGTLSANKLLESCTGSSPTIDLPVKKKRRDYRFTQHGNKWSQNLGGIGPSNRPIGIARGVSNMRTHTGLPPRNIVLKRKEVRDRLDKVFGKKVPKGNLRE